MRKMSEYLTIDQLINKLATTRAEFGNIPVLVSADGTDEEFLRPIGDVFIVNIKDKKIGDNQVCLVISNYEVEEATEDDTSMKTYTEGD